jgi:uncharacterized membrane protein SpoIIM required for sporulation
MILSQFIQAHKDRWQELDALLQRIESRRLRALGRIELKRLGQLYRVVATDVAVAQTNFPNSDIARTLNELAARAHPLVYRSRSLTAASVWMFFRVELPQTFRRHIHYFSMATVIFCVAALLGAIATLLDESAAGIILSPKMIESVHRHEMWTDHIFSVVPGSVMSARIVTNNISVTFMVFAFGLTFGVGTCYMLALNGLMLGCVISLCARYDMLGPLLAFVTAHGVVEISIILVAGGAGLMIGGALIAPGDYTRRDALAVQGQEGVKLVLGTAPLLIIVGLIEGFVSPQPLVPAMAKILLGLLLGALFYLHLLLSGRGATTDPVV